MKKLLFILLYFHFIGYGQEASINSPLHKKAMLFDYDGSIGTLKFGVVSVLKSVDQKCKAGWAIPTLLLVN